MNLSIIVPVYNERENIAPFLARVRQVLEEIDVSYEIIFVDDGSQDGSDLAIKAAAEHDSHIRLIQFTRNFGKEAALTAGLDWASGEAAVPIDCDLQHPPEVIPKFIQLWREGYDIVYARRVSRQHQGRLSRGAARAFYRIFNAMASMRIEEDAGDFRLLSRSAIDATVTLRERNRFMKGLFAWVGFRSIAVEYECSDRDLGESRFNFIKLWNFALDGITSFSTLPLRIWTYVGLIVALFSLVYTILILAEALIFGRSAPGYASLMVVILFLGAVQLISLGIIGEYLGRLYIESKQRPIYLVGLTHGWNGQQGTPIMQDDASASEHSVVSVR